MPRRNGSPKPQKTAAERRLEDFSSVGIQAEASVLPRHADVQIRQELRPKTEEGVRGNVKGARRMDAFEQLKASMKPGAYDAARRLERDITMSRGEHDSGRPLQRVDGDEEAARGRTDAMIDASGRVRRVLGRIGPQDAKLLFELIAPSTNTLLRVTSWRDVVKLVTGESHVNSQGTAVRMACANLAGAYRSVEDERRRAA